MQSDIMIRNDRHIDLTPHPDYDTLVLNERGWVSAKDGITDYYQVEEGDEAFFNIWQFRHLACQRAWLQTKEREYFRKMFSDAGIPVRRMQTIPNEYDPSYPHYAPWFMVYTPIGTFKIGWRKRVINIDWTKAEGQYDGLFADQDVTQGANHVHAWGTEKGTEYLSRIAEASQAVLGS